VSSLSRRLDNLEDRSREHATAEVLTAWERLTDAEVVRIVAPFCFDREPTSEEQAAHETFQEEVSEDLIARAIGLRAEIDEGEIDRRIGGLVALVQERRRARVTRMLTDYEKGVRR
jgi:hypothetical protein